MNQKNNSTEPNKRRCDWCVGDPLYEAYHDQEWGVPVYDEQTLFEFLILEGTQAGLSWITVLKKRENYRVAFDGFNIEKIINYNDQKIEELLQNVGIIRNRLKVQSVIRNAKAWKAMRDGGVDMVAYLWQFHGGKVQNNQRQSMADVPAETPESQAMSKALKKQGFNFVGPTICYAFMQATGMVNDHVQSCFKYPSI